MEFANTGRFTSEDKIRGFLDKPITLNPYDYCWNKPLDQVDLNGMYPTAALAGAMQGILSGTDTPTAGVSDAIGKILSGENPNNSPNAGVSDDINKLLRGESVDAGHSDNGEVAECDKSLWDKVWDYILKTLEMLFKGNASEDVTLLGVIAEIAAAIFGVDIILDVRDIIADVLQIINE